MAAVSDTATPVSVYDSYQFKGWELFGGTSVATPLVAGIEAQASEYARSLPGADIFYSEPNALFDVTSGNNSWEGEPCRAPAEDPAASEYLCNGEVGYDGPTGNGSPNGIIKVTGLPPLAITRPATEVTAGAAKLVGTTVPQGLKTTYHFEYGTTKSYGTSTAATSAGSATSGQEATEAISGLSANTTYYYRLVASNSAGIAPEKIGPSRPPLRPSAASHPASAGRPGGPP